MPTPRRVFTVRCIAISMLTAAAGIGVSVAGPAAAQPGVPAEVKAVASPWMPTLDRVQVQALEASDVDQQLAGTIAQALARRGITVDPSAPLILYYDTQISGDTADSAAGGTPTVDQTEIAAPGSSQELFPAGDVGPLYGEYAPGVMPESLGLQIGPGGAVATQSEGIAPTTAVPLGGAETGGGPGYSLNFTLGRDGGSPVWSGSITTSLPEQDPVTVARLLTPALVAAIGRSGTSKIVIPNPDPR